MTKQLVEDIMQLEAEAEQQIAKAATDADTIIRKAQEKALLLVQEAEHTLDTEREALIKQRSKQLTAEKEKSVENARTEAKALAATLSKRVPKASEYLLAQFVEQSTQ
jgi:vacuolar-type H+-ATPase subunit H